jgi:serine protease
MRTRLLAAAMTATLASLVFSAGASATGGSPAPSAHGPSLSRHAKVFRPVGWRRTHPLPARQAPLADVNLQYNGGSVLTSPGAFVIFWGTDWASGFSTGGFSSDQAQSYVDSFLGGVGGSGWINSQTQYCQNTTLLNEFCAGDPNAQFVTNPGQQLLGTWVDGSAVPASPTDADVRAEAQNAVAHFGYSANAVYMVFTPTGHNISGFGTQFCAYHDNTTFNGQPLAYANMPYIPDAGASCGMNFVNGTDGFGHGFFDGFSIVTGHEYGEAATDAFPSQTIAWIDSAGSETGDKCAWNQGPGPDFATQNVTFAGQFFAVQPLWSNNANGGTGGCAIAG